MNKTFYYSSESRQSELEVEISIYATDEDDGGFEFEYIYDKTNDKDILLEDLPHKEQDEVEQMAADLSYEYMYEAWEAALQSMADAAHDAYKEGLYDQED